VYQIIFEAVTVTVAAVLGAVCTIRMRRPPVRGRAHSHYDGPRRVR
jgi:hypothetical protein